MIQANNWVEGVYQCHQHGLSYVLVTVLQVEGSSPRELGAKMVVTAERQIDTIGGGRLEFEVLAHARKLLGENQHTQQRVSYPLASKLGQCCGGKVEILFEVQFSHTQHLAVFGAGHVAKALMPIIQQLSLKIDWVDSRANQFPDNTASNVTTHLHDEPQWFVDQLPANSWVLIMTHCHQLDFDIVRHAVQRTDIPFIGLIGSEHKARKFAQRLAHRDMNDAGRLVCPVGEPSIPGKKPIEVAVSISGQLIAMLNKCEPDLKASLTEPKSGSQSKPKGLVHFEN